MRDGVNAKLPRIRVDDRSSENPHDWEYEDGHTFLPVYVEMLLQISANYSTLPDVRELKASEILFFYEGYRETLKVLTKPKG